jgi:hypothetical protein
MKKSSNSLVMSSLESSFSLMHLFVTLSLTAVGPVMLPHGDEYVLST